jgi:myo-inositol-1(or 4)-monophosphatase
MDYNELNQTLQAIVREAGRFMLGSSETNSTDKTNKKDFVTVADIKSQNIIEQRLQERYPHIFALSEEHSEEERKKLFEPDFTGFVMDPIDGTYNFKRDMRESAVSVGYIENGEPKTGVVYDPYKEELYAATVGKGATRNGQPIHVSNQADIAGASVTTSNSYDDEAMARNLKRHIAIYEQTGHMPWTNCPGSGVLILTYIACGRHDIYHHNGLKPWDNAAAFLLIREAGGKVLTLKGEEAPFTSATVLAGPPALVAKLQEVFRKSDQILLS